MNQLLLANFLPCFNRLTGHPKGGAAAWMLNGMAQVVQSGLIPGNRNADNISQELRKFEYLLYPSKSIQTDGIKAGLLTSFGFGQVSSLTLCQTSLARAMTDWLLDTGRRTSSHRSPQVLARFS